MANTDTKINIRIDKKTKEEAQKAFSSLGLDISSGVKIFLKSVINTQSIPFEVRTQNGYTASFEKKIIKDVLESKKNRKIYASASELISDIDSWDSEGSYVSN